jgi:hypothetical protein
LSESGLNRWLGLETDADGELSLTVRSLYKSLGGALGVVSSAIPPLSFSFTYTLTSNVTAGVIVAVTFTTIFLTIDIIRRKPIMNAIAALLGIGMAAWLALRGGAGDFFVKDLWVNGLWASGLGLSVLIGVPVFGYLLQSLGELEPGWRKQKPSFRKMTLLTAMWSGLYIVRLTVQLPFYFANNIAALGIAKFLLGLPTFALWCFFTWLLLRKAHKPSA